MTTLPAGEQHTGTLNLTGDRRHGMSGSERFTTLRAAPEPRLKEIPDDEAITLAKTAFYAARRAQLELLSQSLNQMLFDPSTVSYVRLRGLRTEARLQVQKAQQVEQLIGDAIEAFEATTQGRR